MLEAFGPAPFFFFSLSEARRDPLELVGSALLLVEAHPLSLSISRSPFGPAHLFWETSTPLSFEPFGLAQPYVPEDGTPYAVKAPSPGSSLGRLC